MNISNYLLTTVARGTTSWSFNGASTNSTGFLGSTGDAVAYSTALGFPYATTSFDQSGFEGIRAIAVLINATGGSLQPLISNVTTGAGTAAVTSSGWAVSLSTSLNTLGAVTSYSTQATALVYDLYRPQARFIGFYGSVPTSSAYVATITVDQYGYKREPTNAGNLQGEFTVGSTVFISPATG